MAVSVDDFADREGDASGHGHIIGSRLHGGAVILLEAAPQDLVTLQEVRSRGRVRAVLALLASSEVKATQRDSDTT